MKRLVSSLSFIWLEMASRAAAFCSREMVGSLMKRPKSALSAASFCTWHSQQAGRSQPACHRTGAMLAQYQQLHQQINKFSQV